MKSTRRQGKALSLTVAGLVVGIVASPSAKADQPPPLVNDARPAASGASHGHSVHGAHVSKAMSDGRDAQQTPLMSANPSPRPRKSLRTANVPAHKAPTNKSRPLETAPLSPDQPVAGSNEPSRVDARSLRQQDTTIFPISMNSALTSSPQSSARQRGDLSMPSADIAPVSVRRAVRGRTWPATTRDTDVVAGPSRWGTLQAVDITRFMPTYSSPADGVRSPLTVSSQAPIPGLSDPDIPGGGCLISGALPGVTGMLILTMVGVALGRRHTKLDDTAGVDRLRFMP